MDHKADQDSPKVLRFALARPRWTEHSVSPKAQRINERPGLSLVNLADAVADLTILHSTLSFWRSIPKTI